MSDLGRRRAPLQDRRLTCSGFVMEAVLRAEGPDRGTRKTPNRGALLIMNAETPALTLIPVNVFPVE